MDGSSFYASAASLIDKHHKLFLIRAHDRCRLMTALDAVGEDTHSNDVAGALARLAEVLSNLERDNDADHLLCKQLEYDRAAVLAKMNGEILGIKTEQEDARAEIDGLAQRLREEEWNRTQACQQIKEMNNTITGLSGVVSTLGSELSEAAEENARRAGEGAGGDQQRDVCRLGRRVAELEAQLGASAAQVQELNQKNYTLRIAQYQSNSVLQTQCGYIITANQNLNAMNLRYNGAIAELHERARQMSEKDAQLEAERANVAEIAMYLAEERATVAKLRKELERAEAVQRVRPVSVHTEASEDVAAPEILGDPQLFEEPGEPEDPCGFGDYQDSEDSDISNGVDGQESTASLINQGYEIVDDEFVHQLIWL